MAKHSAQHNQAPAFSSTLRIVSTQSSALPQLKEGLTKAQIAELADASVTNLLEEGGVFGVAETLAAMDEFVRTVRKDERYIQFLRDELAKHQGRLVTTSGAKIEACEAGVSYDYSGNAEWRQLEAERFEMERRKKCLEEKLRLIAPGRMVVDPETGEMLEGPQKTSKSTYRITLAHGK